MKDMYGNNVDFFGDPIQSGYSSTYGSKNLSDSEYFAQKGQQEKDRLDSLAPNENRTNLNRFLDLISVGMYAGQGLIHGAITPGETALGSAWEGIKASNPFGGGNEKGEYTFSQNLDQMGWKPTSTVGKVVRGVAGFVGDVALDPLTYATFGVGGVARGTGTKIAGLAKDVKAFTPELADQALKAIHGADYVPEAKDVADLISRVNKKAGIVEKTDRGVGLYADDFPLINKLPFMKGKQIELATEESVRKFGDKTIAPYFNAVRDKFQHNPYISTKGDMIDLARNDPKELVKLFEFTKMASEKELSHVETLNKLKTEYKGYAELDPVKQRQISDILENKHFWKDTTVNNPLKETEDGKNMWDKIQGFVEKWGNEDLEVAKVMHDIKPKFKEGDTAVMHTATGDAEVKIVGEAGHKNGMNYWETEDGHNVPESLLKSEEDVANETMVKTHEEKKVRIAEEVANQDRGRINLSDDAHQTYKENIAKAEEQKHIDTVKQSEQLLDKDGNAIYLPNHFKEANKAQFSPNIIERGGHMADKDGLVLAENVNIKKPLYENTKVLGFPKQTYMGIKNKVARNDFSTMAEVAVDDVSHVKNFKPQAYDKEADKIYIPGKSNSKGIYNVSKGVKYNAELEDYFYRLIDKDPVLSDLFKPLVESGTLNKKLDSKTIEEFLDKYYGIANKKGEIPNVKSLQGMMHRMSSDYPKVRDILKAEYGNHDLLNDRMRRMRMSDMYMYLNNPKLTNEKWNNLNKISNQVENKLGTAVEDGRNFGETGYNKTTNSYVNADEIKEGKDAETMSAVVYKNGNKVAQAEYVDGSYKQIMMKDGHIHNVADLEDKGYKIWNPANKGNSVSGAAKPFVKYSNPEKERQALIKEQEAMAKVSKILGDDEVSLTRDTFTTPEVKTEPKAETKHYGRFYSINAGSDVENMTVEALQGIKTHLRNKLQNLVDSKSSAQVPGQVQTQIDLVRTDMAYANSLIEKKSVKIEPTNIIKQIKEEIKSDKVFQEAQAKADTQRIGEVKKILVTKETHPDLIKAMPSMEGKYIQDFTDVKTSNIVPEMGKRDVWKDESIISEPVQQPPVSSFVKETPIAESVKPTSYAEFQTKSAEVEQTIQNMPKHIEDAINDYKANPAMSDAKVNNIKNALKTYQQAMSNDAEFERFARTIWGDEKVDNIMKDHLASMTVMDKLDLLPEDVRKIVLDIKDKFKEIAVDEMQIGKLDNVMFEGYLAHILNPQAKAFIDGLAPDFLENNGIRIPKNKFDMSREYRVGTEMPNGIKFNKGYTLKHDLKSVDGTIYKAGTKLADDVVVEHGTILKEGVVHEINDIMKPILQHDLFINEISDVYLARMQKHYKLMYEDGMVQDLVNKFGERHTPGEIHGDNKTLVYSTQDMKNHLKGKSTKYKEDMFAELGTTADDFYKLGESLQHLTTEQADKFVSKLGIKVHSLSNVILDKYKSITKVQMAEDVNGLLGAYDKFLQGYKIAVTAMRPAFHVNNIRGNAFNNYLDIGSRALSPKYNMASIDMIRRKEGSIVLAGKEYSYAELIREAKMNNVIDRGFFGQDIKKSIERDVEKATKPRGIIGKAVDLGTKVGGHVEDQGRLVNWIANIDSGKSFAHSAEHVDEFLFDYADITKFEHQVMQRVFPFYTWMRKNSMLQLEQMFEHPKKYMPVAKAISEIQGTVDKHDRVKKNKLPAFAQDWVQLPFNITNEKGQNEVLMWNNSLPYMDVNRIPDLFKPKDAFGTVLGMSSPVIKIPTELATNTNYYLQQKIDNGKQVLDPTGEFKVSPQTAYFLQQVPQITEPASIIKKQGLDAFVHLLDKFAGSGVKSYNYGVHSTEGQFATTPGVNPTINNTSADTTTKQKSTTLKTTAPVHHSATVLHKRLQKIKE